MLLFSSVRFDQVWPSSLRFGSTQLNSAQIGLEAAGACFACPSWRQANRRATLGSSLLMAIDLWRVSSGRPPNEPARERANERESEREGSPNLGCRLARTLARPLAQFEANIEWPPGGRAAVARDIHWPKMKDDRQLRGRQPRACPSGLGRRDYERNTGLAG